MTNEKKVFIMQSRRSNHAAPIASVASASRRLNLKPLAFAVRLTLSAAVLGGIGSPACAQLAAQAVSYDIPAGPLGQAAKE